MEGLSSWSLLGAFLAALVGFGAYMYGGLDARGADQAGVGEFVIPKLQVAHLTQPSEGLSQSTKNSSSSTEAAEYTLSAEDTPPISNDSQHFAVKLTQVALLSQMQPLRVPYLPAGVFYNKH